MGEFPNRILLSHAPPEAYAPMTRAILAGYSFKSGPPMKAHFGLGATKAALQIQVFWPSGTVQTLRNVKGDRYLTITEPR